MIIGRKMTAKEKREMNKFLDRCINVILFPFTLPAWLIKQSKKKRRKKKLFK